MNRSDKIPNIYTEARNERPPARLPSDDAEGGAGGIGAPGVVVVQELRRNKRESLLDDGRNGSQHGLQAD